MNRIAVGIEYDGSRFFGWQTQAQTPTVQQTLEGALAQVADSPVVVHGSGRTDTGVHARCQVAHFDSNAERPERAWTLGVNTHLPDDIRVLWARVVADDFHARFSAQSRAYQYTICNRPVRPALNRATQAWVGPPLDADAMQIAAQALVGEHDFTSFRATACQARHAVRRLHCIEVHREGERILIAIDGNAFLHHMVRNIVGSLTAVGRGQRPPQWIGEILRQRDRTVAGVTAPANGLTLQGVRYPDRFGLPRFTTDG